MKIISWNINGIRSLLGQNPSRKYDQITRDNKLFTFIEQEEPDIIMLQETKAEPEQILPELRCPPGYHGYFNHSKARKGYSGVVTYSKIEAIRSETNIGIDRFDIEGRVSETEYKDFVLFNVYFPNGTSGMDRVDYKLEFYDALFDYVERIRAKGKPIIISGDYNTAHYPIDLARPKENEEVSGFLPIEREKLDKIVNMGYVDTYRMFTSEGNNYTWWSQRGRARENNVGWRIDYHFVTDNFTNSIRKSYHMPDVQGSDHCPIVIEIDL